MNRRSDLVWGVGPRPCLGMIVGIAPSVNEVAAGEPFVGPAGETLNDALNAAGASRGDFYITNVYKLKTVKNVNPTDDQIRAHAPYLLDELRDVEPHVILLLGEIPVRTFGLLRPEKQVITKHPSWVRRDRKAREPQFYSDVTHFVELVEDAKL